MVMGSLHHGELDTRCMREEDILIVGLGGAGSIAEHRAANPEPAAGYHDNFPSTLGTGGETIHPSFTLRYPVWEV
jgi:hypothetical protein